MVASHRRYATRPGNYTLFAKHMSTGEHDSSIFPFVISPAYVAQWVLLHLVGGGRGEASLQRGDGFVHSGENFQCTRLGIALAFLVLKLDVHILSDLGVGVFSILVAKIQLSVKLRGSESLAPEDILGIEAERVNRVSVVVRN